jgi:hypothetical protein
MATNYIRVALLSMAFLASQIGSTARAATPVNLTLPFSVPAVITPTVACVRLDSHAVCNPAPTTAPLQIVLSARLSEANHLMIAEGAPASRRDGHNCARLAKTITLQLGVQSSLAVHATTTPAIDHRLNGPTVPGQLQRKTVELCVNG